MNKHAPGPWAVNGASIIAPGYRCPRLVAVLRLEGMGGYATRDANGRLIAHAPELLETVRRLAGQLITAAEGPPTFEELLAELGHTGRDLQELLARIDGEDAS